MQKTDDLFFSHGDSSEPVPSTSFKPTDSWLPTQESKETSQESANTTY